MRVVAAWYVRTRGILGAPGACCAFAEFSGARATVTAVNEKKIPTFSKAFFAFFATLMFEIVLPEIAALTRAGAR